METSAAVARWRLAPHPEGGFFRETYRSPLTTIPAGWPGPRALATCILYLLPAGQRSAWHRVRGEELWLWQGGAAMALSTGESDTAGPIEPGHPEIETGPAPGTHLVGPDPAAGHQLQVLVPAGAWQSAMPAGDGPWSLIACVVAPGFDFADFELR